MTDADEKALERLDRIEARIDRIEKNLWQSPRSVKVRRLAPWEGDLVRAIYKHHIEVDLKELARRLNATNRQIGAAKGHLTGIRGKMLKRPVPSAREAKKQLRKLGIKYR